MEPGHQRRKLMRTNYLLPFVPSCLLVEDGWPPALLSICNCPWMMRPLYSTYLVSPRAIMAIAAGKCPLSSSKPSQLPFPPLGVAAQRLLYPVGQFVKCLLGISRCFLVWILVYLPNVPSTPEATDVPTAELYHHGMPIFHSPHRPYNLTSTCTPSQFVMP